MRLDGPVDGRSAVCRDLTQDLMRVKDVGVCCIICCLDDEELEFLGAPWPEYWRIANELGLDVVRLPMPEGLAPLNVELFDTHLRRLINTYTLNGRRTLVHCRGGVGRAGLVACCWMVKLGLCGWFDCDSESCNSPFLSSPAAQGQSTPLTQSMTRLDGGVRQDTLQFVRSVLQVVRKQRSLKAVETFEQVKFLVDYVEYLRRDDMISPVDEMSTDDVVYGWDFQTEA